MFMTSFKTAKKLKKKKSWERGNIWPVLKIKGWKPT